MKFTILLFQINGLDRLASSECETLCGDGGCYCHTKVQLSEIDHLVMISEDGKQSNCICGPFRSEWLPVSLRTWNSIKLVYSISHYSWSTKGFNFQASYNFTNDALCGQKTFTTHNGELIAHNYSNNHYSLNSFYHQQCIWILDSNVERLLTVEIETEQSRSCTAWNISLHEFLLADSDLNHVGTQLYNFCPRDKRKAFTMPWTLNTVVVRYNL